MSVENEVPATPNKLFGEIPAGPKLSQADIEATIVGVTYCRLGESTATVCQLTLRNGFVVEGISHCAAPENFNQEEGEKWARKAAVEKIWDLEGYLLKERLHQKQKLRETVYEISPNRVSQWPSMEDLDNLQLQMATVDDPVELREAMAALIKGIINYYNFAGERVNNLQHALIEASSQPTNFRLTSEINAIVGNHPTGDVRAWRRQAGLIRDEVVELLEHVHLDALHKFDFVKICMAFMSIWNYYDNENESEDNDPELVAAHQAAYDFVKLHNYQDSIFTGPTDGVPTSSWPSVNPYAVRDDIQDILVTAYGLSHRMGFDADEDHAEVYRSNLTKFDTTAEGAAATQGKYQKLGIKTRVEPTTHHLRSLTRNLGQESLTADFVEYHIVKVDGTQTGTDGKVYPDGKFLKSLNFEEPNYKPVLIHKH